MVPGSYDKLMPKKIITHANSKSDSMVSYPTSVVEIFIGSIKRSVTTWIVDTTGIVSQTADAYNMNEPWPIPE